LPRLRTDNSHLWLKVRLRAEELDRIAKPQITVVSAYSGEGLLWREVARVRPDIDLVITKIDKRKVNVPGLIFGDNRRILPGLNLDGYDLIDLDAYGWPHEQLRICAENAPNVPVVTTIISFPRGRVPHDVLRGCGVPTDWEVTAPFLMQKQRWDWWDGYCAHLGYRWEKSRYSEDKGMSKRYQVLRRAPPPMLP